MEFARIAARRFGAEHHEYYVTPADLVQSMADVAGHYDQPFGNSSVLPAFYCAKMARDDGVTRLLAGDGGDELFGGNSRYAKQRIFGWYDQVPGALRSSLVDPAQQPGRAAGGHQGSARTAPGAQGVQLRRASPRAHARPPAALQPAHPAGRGCGLHAGLPGLRRPACSTSARCGPNLAPTNG